MDAMLRSEKYDDALVARQLFKASGVLRDTRAVNCLMAISSGYLGRVVTLLQVAGRRAFLRGADAIDVKVPRLEPKQAAIAPEWAQAMSSMRRIWDDTPEGAQVIKRMLDAVADLQSRAD